MAESDTPPREWLLSRVLDSSVDAIIVIDEHGIIVEWNTQSMVMFGWAKDEALGRFIHETVIPERLRSNHIKGIERYLETGESRILEQRLEVVGLRQNGSEFPAELTVTGHSVGETKRFTAFVRDLSEQKALEDRLRAQELQSARLARFNVLAELSTGIAHELNQPLNAITVLSSIAEATQDVGQLKASLSDVGRYAARAGELVQQFLQLASNGEGTREQVSVEDLVTTARNHLQAELRQYGVTLQVDIQSPNPVVHGEKAQLEQVLVHILQNALEALHITPHPAIDITIVELEYQVTMIIANNGPRLRDEQVFEAFHTDKDNAIGLGLTICRTTVERHGGSIRLNLDSEFTAFELSLPKFSDD
ncbi:MAG: PAS domain S-box protein [Pseudomonadales bacterium]|nr:PAS domain S-box protein [Pseudomonadales bacterium]